MKSKRINKNKKLRKTRSKRGAGLFNTQKIIDSAECKPVKQLGNYQKFSADQAFSLYNKCCPKASISGKANFNFKCKTLYDTYLNKTKQQSMNQNNFGVAKEERASIPGEPNLENPVIQNKDNDEISERYTDAVIEEQNTPNEWDDDNKYYGVRYGPKQQFPPNPTYIENLKKYGQTEDYERLNKQFPPGSYKPDEDKKKWWRFGFGGKKIKRKTKKILRKNIKKH